MRTLLECLPCLLHQALAAARLATGAAPLQKKIMTEVLRLLPSFDHDRSPPENAVEMYRLISRLADCPDPFAELKEASNRLALDLRPQVAARIDQAPDPLQAAVRFAMAGNVIDYGAPHDLRLDRLLTDCLEQPLAIDDYDRFVADLRQAETVLYLGDNCGELVFDSLLLERLNKQVVLAVKKSPIINDALRADAAFCGLDRLCRVITNGTDCPGTPLAHCNPAFQELFARADLIISKGQGNFETLSEVAAPLYFLLTVKCLPVAEHLADKAGFPPGRIQPGSLVLFRQRHSSLT